MNTKICTKCKIEKSLDDFYINKKTKLGVASWCKECVKILRSKNYLINRENELASNKKWRQKNRTPKYSVETHKMSYTKFYGIYRGIIGRCRYPSHVGYMRYGGRGIKCEWISFESFKDDMYKEYLKARSFLERPSIERINVNGNYCKENCTWIELKDQPKNTRKTKRPIRKSAKLTGLK